ncbi:MAG: polymer-forming cytoskeletal protein [Bacteroidota bacterium]
MPATTSSSPSTGINSLGTATKIIGNLTADSDIRLDGILEGNVICGAKLILGPKGKISGEVQCQNAVIEGAIEGVLRVKDHLHLKETARVKGEIYTNKMQFQTGAKFDGKCEMGGQTIAPKMAIPKEAKTA